MATNLARVRHEWEILYGRDQPYSFDWFRQRIFPDRDLVKRIIGWSSMDLIDRYGHIGHRAIPAFRKINHALQERLKV